MNMIINGIPDESFKSFESELERRELTNAKYFKMRDMTINYCQGCWDCWVKTPGICVFKDDYVDILSLGPSADRVTLITPIIAGYESSLIKKWKDRFIPMIHPYVELYKGEQHHRQRYEKNPDIRVIVLEDDFTTDEDIEMIQELYERISLNLRYEFLGVTRLKKGADYSHVIDDI